MPPTSPPSNPGEDHRAAGGENHTTDVAPGVGHVGARDLARDPMLRPVRSGNVFEETVSRLLQTIRLGTVAPGERLPPERELAAMLDVSRDTVREAIRSLQDAGYLVSRRGRYGGTFVRESRSVSVGAGIRNLPRRAEEIADVLVLRDVLEVGAARAAAAVLLDEADRAEFTRRLDAVRSAGPADYRRLDSRFHLMLGEITGSPSLVTLLADNRMRVNDLLDEIPLLERNIRHSNEQHERLAHAILQGDTDASALAMTEHLAGTAALLRGFLE